MTRVAVVTGGASGIGEATARLLAQRGVAVAVFDVAGDDPVDVTGEDDPFTSSVAHNGTNQPGYALELVKGPRGARSGIRTRRDEGSRCQARRVARARPLSRMTARHSPGVYPKFSRSLI